MRAFKQSRHTLNIETFRAFTLKRTSDFWNLLLQNLTCTENKDIKLKASFNIFLA